MDLLGGGVDLLREELEGIVAGSAKETADRMALLCAVRTQAALEEERRVLRATGCSSPLSPLSRPGSECQEPSPKGGSSSRYATEAWTRGFYDDKLASMCAPAPPERPAEEPLEALGLQDQDDEYDCAGIMRSAYAIKGKVHDALTSGRTAAASSSEKRAPGEALRNSKCNIRNVMYLCSHIFQQGVAEAQAAAPPSRPAASTAPPPPRPEPAVGARGAEVRQPLPPPTSPPPAAIQAMAKEAVVAEPAATLAERTNGRGQDGAARTAPAGDLERQRAMNEELSRTLLELTAELQKHNIISGEPAELPKGEGSESPVSPSGRKATEYWHIGD